MLFTILHYITLQSTTLLFTTLHSTILQCTPLYCSSLDCTPLNNISLHCNSLQSTIPVSRLLPIPATICPIGQAVIVHCKLYSVQCTLYNVHCILYTIYYTMYSVHYTVYTTHYLLYSAHWTVHLTHCTLHTVHCTIGQFGRVFIAMLQPNVLSSSLPKKNYEYFFPSSISSMSCFLFENLSLFVHRLSQQNSWSNHSLLQ